MERLDKTTSLAAASSNARKLPLFLRLEPIGENGGRIEIPLKLDDGTAGYRPTLDAYPGFVRQSGRYHLALLVPQEVDVRFTSAMLMVNGEEVPCVRVGQRHSTVLKDDVVMSGYEMDAADPHARPFGLVCGYARMQVELRDEYGQPTIRLSAKDILCQQDTPTSHENVEAMVKALIGDPAEDRALSWMLSDGASASASAYSLLQGGFSQTGSRSVPTYLAIIEEGLDAAEAALPFLRSHAASRIQREDHVVESRQVRKIGGSEARWLAMHPGELKPSPRGYAAIVYKGHAYAPMRLSSACSFRSLDVYENRLCVSFLLTVASDLADFESNLQYGIDAIAPRRVGREGGASGSILMINVANVLRGRQREYQKKAVYLHKRARRLLRLYERILPGVKTKPLGEMRLLRTKTFKEIQAYSQLFRHIKRFCKAGESVLKSEGLALTAFRLDSAYETYALYRILQWLSNNGYAPIDDERALYAGCYGYTSNVFADAPHVANVYRLNRGSVSVEVYYEPVIFADEREAHGITLHRLHGTSDSVYTPDYVIIVRREGGQAASSKQVFVLDAKYRSCSSLLRRYSNEYGKTSKSAFEDRAESYLLNMVDAETGRIPDGLWLLSGVDDGDAPLVELPALPWSSAHAPAFSSGIALVTPSFDIDDLFKFMGLSSSGSTPMTASLVEAGACEVEREDDTDSEPSTRAMLFDGGSDDMAIGYAAQEPMLEDGAGSLVKIDCGAVEQERVSLVACAVDDKGRDVEGGSGVAVAVGPLSGGDFGRASPPEEGSAVEKAPEHATPKRSGRAQRREAQRQLEREAAKAKQQRREEKIRQRKEGQAQRKRHEASKAHTPGTGSSSLLQKEFSSKAIENLVLEIVDTAVDGKLADFFDASSCKWYMDINRPLLSSKKAKDYLPLSGHDNLYFYFSKLPKYAKALEKYLDQVRSNET